MLRLEDALDLECFLLPYTKIDMLSNRVLIYL